MQLPRLILVGGFLGAGKTTHLAQVALRLAKLGKRVGLVANDQAAELVDTEVLRLSGACVEEVSGGCFCCRFPDMIAALERLRDRERADVLLGEPVGSCTDLAATVMHPLKDLHGGQFDLAPLSVLVDGKQVRTLARLRAAGVPGALRLPTQRHTECAGYSDNVLYIYEKQLEEADLIVLNKADRLTPAELADLTASLAERFPNKPVVTMSALTGAGVDAWLDFVMVSKAAAPHVVEVDYDAYAAGEATLGWLNASVALRSKNPMNWSAFAESLLSKLRKPLLARSAEIAHVKVILQHGEQSLTANATSATGPLSILGSLSDAAGEATMRLNARVHIAAEELRTVCENALREATAAFGVFSTITALQSLSPGRPVPTHRYS